MIKLPCGCDKGKCKCNLSALEYAIRYSSKLSTMLKKKGLLKNKKKEIIKAAGKQLKDAVRFLKKK